MVMTIFEKNYFEDLYFIISYINFYLFFNSSKWPEKIFSSQIKDYLKGEKKN